MVVVLLYERENLPQMCSSTTPPMNSSDDTSTTVGPLSNNTRNSSRVSHRRPAASGKRRQGREWGPARMSMSHEWSVNLAGPLSIKVFSIRQSGRHQSAHKWPCAAASQVWPCMPVVASYMRRPGASSGV